MQRVFMIICLALSSIGITRGQNDVMLQSFYWDVPVDGENKKGLWWNNLKDKADSFKELGITALWIPAPSKGNWGIYDMGYGVYDHYDLGNYYQKGSVETRFGSRRELESMVNSMHDTANGQQRIDVYADIILNHMYASDENAEPNPVVKQYVFDEAVRHGEQHVPYPTDEIKWVIPDADAGKYQISIKGYYLDFDDSYSGNGYEVQVDFENSGFDDSYTWGHERPGGEVVRFPQSGHGIRNFIRSEDDFDTYEVVAPGGRDIVIRLFARQMTEDGWVWADQTNGYYPFQVIYEGKDITDEKLEAHTNTFYYYPQRTCDNEPHYTWNYSHFHPADHDGWLSGWGEEGEVIPRTKAYGNDLNTFDPQVRQRLKDWGTWLVEQINFDGFRLDFVWGYQESFAAAWINNLPLLNGRQRFIVSEYWGPASRIHYWYNAVTDKGAQTSVFDFPLKFTLTQMCNSGEEFDMRDLNNAGLIRNNQGYRIPASSVVTFLENHDTGKEHDKWVTQDWQLGHAYILTHKGRPCLFYPHLYAVTLLDMTDHSKEQEIPASVNDDIHDLIHIRNTYLGGKLKVLSKKGNPAPAENVSDVYVARREGNGAKEGAIIVLNNSQENKGLRVDTHTGGGFGSWEGETLVNVLNPSEKTEVDTSGRAWFEAPARGYAVFVPEKDYEPEQE